MPSKKNKLTPIKIKMENLVKRLEVKSDAEIDAWERQKQSRQMITDSVKEAKELISKQPQPPEQILFSFEPTSMTRTSPFFPMSKRDMKNRPMERGLTWDHSWGRITISGERLSVYDESVLLSLLVLVKKHRSESFLTTQYELCKIMAVARGKNTYNAIWQSIDRMTRTGIKLELWEGKGKNRKPVRDMSGPILVFGDRDRKTGKMKIKINDYFLEMFAGGLITGIDMRFRALLKGDTSKALYRFFQGQRGFYQKGYYEIHLLTLCVAINVHVEGVETHRLRSLIRSGLRELRKQGFLNRWQLNKNDYTMVWRADKNRLEGKR